MLFNSIGFMIFFPTVVLLYFVIPYKIRWAWLLIASYYFYMCWNPVYALLMANSTLITYACGLILKYSFEKGQGEKAKKRRKLWLAICIVLNLSILFFYKYFNFVGSNINRVLSSFHLSFEVPLLDVLLPVGISFYTFQAIGYAIDVYRGDIEAETHLGKYALFVAFFPQLVAGPIERSGNLIKQIHTKHQFDSERAVSGLIQMLWGFFQKVVIADRIAVLVSNVFNNYKAYEGFEILITIILFSIQIYCDFGGYSNIAIGAGRVMGFELMENFKRPYFSKSIKEFWRRWHISLSFWLKDYLYIPLGGSRCSKLKRYRNILITFLVSGIWHGSGWTYIIWGLLHGIYQVLGELFMPIKNFFIKSFKVDKQSFSHKLFSVLLTYSLVNFAWIFFRAPNISTALGVIKQMVSSFNPWIFFDDSLYEMGLSTKDMHILFLCLGILLGVELWERKQALNVTIRKQPLVLRWIIYFTMVFGVLIFGVYGPGYAASQFIYFQF